MAKKNIRFTLTTISKTKHIDPLSEPLWANDIKQIRTTPGADKLYETGDAEWAKAAEAGGLILLNGDHLFCWDEVPGIDNEKLIQLLDDPYDVDLGKKPQINKSNDGNVIEISGNQHQVRLTINESKNRLGILIDETRTGELLVRANKDKLNIYYMPNPGKPKKKIPMDFVYFTIIDEEKYKEFTGSNPVPDTFKSTVEDPRIKMVSVDYKKWVDKGKTARCIEEVKYTQDFGFGHIILEKTQFDSDPVVYRIPMCNGRGVVKTLVLQEKDACNYSRARDKYLAAFQDEPLFTKKSWEPAFVAALKKDSETVVVTGDTDPFVLDVLNKINDPGNRFCFDLKDYAKAVGDDTIWVDERAQRVHLTSESIGKLAEPYKLSREKARQLLIPYLNGKAKQERIPKTSKREIFWPFKMELLHLGGQEEPENSETPPKEPENPDTLHKTQPKTEKTNDPIPNAL